MNQHLSECDLCRIDIDRLGVRRGGQTLLEEVSLHLHCGQLTALIGPNGAGKTTLLRALLGELPYTGAVRHVRHDGKSAQSVRTGYVPQQLDFDRSAPVTVLDLFASTSSRRAVWLGTGPQKRKEVQAALAVSQSEGLIDRRLGALSGGELQRVLLALALWPTPDLLILDEPVSGVDASGLSLFYDTVLRLRSDFHMAILLVSHDFETVRAYADFVVLLERRVLAAGTPEEVFQSPAFAALFRGRGEA